MSVIDSSEGKDMVDDVRYTKNTAVYLTYRIVRGPAASRSYPLVAQVIVLLCFVLVIVGGLAAPHVSARMAGTLRNTNLAALVVWSLWWPLVIITAATLGRVWCQVCPMELVNSLVSRFGLRRPIPRFLSSGWGFSFFYALALLGFIRTLSANRYPDRMAYFFLFLLASCLVMGLVFESGPSSTFLCPSAAARLLRMLRLAWNGAGPMSGRATASDHGLRGRQECLRAAGRGCPATLFPPPYRRQQELPPLHPVQQGLSARQPAAVVAEADG